MCDQAVDDSLEALILNLKNTKALKNELNEELMPIAWHPKRWWNVYMLEDEKKINYNQFLLRVVKVCVGSIQYGGIKTFWDGKLCMNFV